jgi:rubrerythrin
MQSRLSPFVFKRVLQFQRAERNGSILYGYIAKRQKDESNKKAVLETVKAERNHYETFKGYTSRELSLNLD